MGISLPNSSLSIEDKRKTFGLRLKKLRKEAGYKNQGAFSEALDINEFTVQNWEQGKSFPRTMEDCLKLCSLFGCDLDYLFGGIEEKTHSLDFICSCTGLTAGAVENLIRIKEGQTGGYDIDTASEIIFSPYFLPLIKAIQNFDWSLEEIRDSVIHFPPVNAFEADVEARSLPDKIRIMKAFRYEVTEAILRVLDSAADMEKVIRTAENKIRDVEKYYEEKEEENG